MVSSCLHTSAILVLDRAAFYFFWRFSRHNFVENGPHDVKMVHGLERRVTQFYTICSDKNNLLLNKQKTWESYSNSSPQILECYQVVSSRRGSDLAVPKSDYGVWWNQILNGRAIFRGENACIFCAIPRNTAEHEQIYVAKPDATDLKRAFGR